MSEVEFDDGSVVYDVVVDEERELRYAIDTDFLARNGVMLFRNNGTTWLEIQTVMGGRFPLMIDSKRHILQIVIRTKYGDKLTATSPSRGHFTEVNGTWTFVPLEGDEVTHVTIVSASNTDEIVQLMVITC